AARPVARASWLWIGPTLAAGLGLLALMAAGAAEFVLLAVLGALAVAGAFLVLGLASGYLRFGERIATAETVEAIADGLDTGLQIVNGHGRVVYRNRALQRLAGRRAGRHTTLEELFAGEPASAQAFFRLNRAAERGEAWEEEFHVRAGSGAG